MTHANIRVVCFDLGGVLIRICRTWAEGCRAAGLDLRTEFPNGTESANARHEISHNYQTGRITCDAYFNALARAVNDVYSPAEIRRIHDAWMFGEYEGVSPLIDRIHATGLTTAALSNTNHSHWLRMPDFPAVAKLHTPLASHELKLAKPDPAIYREAQRRFAVPAQSILFFDDLIENIDAANAEGWNAVHIDHTGDTARQIEVGLRAHHIAI